MWLFQSDYKACQDYSLIMEADGQQFTDYRESWSFEYIQ